MGQQQSNDNAIAGNGPSDDSSVSNDSETIDMSFLYENNSVDPPLSIRHSGTDTAFWDIIKESVTKTIFTDKKLLFVNRLMNPHTAPFTFALFDLAKSRFKILDNTFEMVRIENCPEDHTYHRLQEAALSEAFQLNDLFISELVTQNQIENTVSKILSSNGFLKIPQIDHSLLTCVGDDVELIWFRPKNHVVIKLIENIQKLCDANDEYKLKDKTFLLDSE